MSTHVPLTHWENVGCKKGKNLKYQHETIVYEIPLSKACKTRIIDVLNQFQDEFGCKLTVRGRNHDAPRRACLETTFGREVDKIHHITLRLLENTQQCHEERLHALCRAENCVDNFVKSMLASPDDHVYIFPSETSDQPVPWVDGVQTEPWTESWKRQMIAHWCRDNGKCF